MPLTPTDVQNKQFTVTRVKAGYAIEEVDSFLDEVESELARLLRENNDLRNRAVSAPAAPAPAPEPEPVRAAAPVAPPAPAAPMGASEGQEAALRTLLLAQRTADEAVAEARAEAAQLVASAQAEAESLLTAARTEAEQTLAAARAEAEQVRSGSRSEADATLSRARAEAERTLATARDQAVQMEQQAAAKVQAATGDLEERQRSLETRIDELHAFEREYRTRLRAYLENQLRELASRTAPDDDGGVGVPATSRTSAVGLAAPADAPALGAGRSGPPQEAPAAPPAGPSGGPGSGPSTGVVPSAPAAVGPFGSEPPVLEDQDQ
ncbi:MAG TPA: DivIVA domain-containing protein [Mycobacteriales bacterium]|nr:DivIVA domain-containing protein [Mycobacteriales bacterium]